jgi:NAD(P)-dependent dehydrogenase (short-subunit alcohol dehydrogenase family)
VTRLDGQVALVTGAGRGNGAAIAAGLAQAGATTVIADIDEASAKETASRIVASGGRARGVALDVTDAAACDALAAEIGALSLLVNNAGVLLRGRLAEDKARANWARTLDVNVNGMFNVTMACLPALRAAKGAIVNIASIQSFIAPPGSAAYSVSKGGVAQFTRALAAELAEDGVRVNAIAPGIIATPMSEATRADPARLEHFLRHVPMRRVGAPEELVGPVLFLLSPSASYVTGAILPVDGGYLTV